MNVSRRQFLGLMGAAGLAGCARTKDMWQSTKNVVASVEMPVISGNGPFTFATVGDLHILDARSTAIVNKAADMINEREDVQFTVVLGDLATDGELVELKLAKNSLDRLERPYFCVPGNHDVHVFSNDIRANFRNEFEETHWREDETDWLFIGLDTCEGAKSEVTVQENQLQWLTQVAERTNTNRPIAIMGHHPFNPNTKAYRVLNADDVLGIFSEHNLKLVAAGHYHGNQEETQDGTLFTTTACCSTTRDNFDNTTSKGFRLFHVGEDDSITTEYVEVMA